MKNYNFKSCEIDPFSIGFSDLKVKFLSLSKCSKPNKLWLYQARLCSRHRYTKWIWALYLTPVSWWKFTEFLRFLFYQFQRTMQLQRGAWQWHDKSRICTANYKLFFISVIRMSACDIWIPEYATAWCIWWLQCGRFSFPEIFRKSKNSLVYWSKNQMKSNLLVRLVSALFGVSTEWLHVYPTFGNKKLKPIVDQWCHYWRTINAGTNPLLYLDHQANVVVSSRGYEHQQKHKAQGNYWPRNSR